MTEIARTIEFYSRPGVVAMVELYCPGCRVIHRPQVEECDGHPTWTWNRSLTSPTFRPSLLCNKDGHYPDRPLCHSWVTDGLWDFLADSTHELAGKKVPMLAVDQWPDAADLDFV